MRIFIALLLLVSAISFGLGITLPLVHFQKLYFFNETPSLITLVFGLWQDESYTIALAVLAFSIVFPLAKLSIVFISAVAPDANLAKSQITVWAGVLSKWSMMDVLLVALVIFAAKSSGLAEAFTQTGLWFYAFSALTGALAAGLLKRDNPTLKEPTELSAQAPSNPS